MVLRSNLLVSCPFIQKYMYWSMVLRSLTLGRCTVMHSFMSEPSQVTETHETSAFFWATAISSLSLLQSYGVAGCEVCRSERTCSTSTGRMRCFQAVFRPCGVALIQLGHRPLWLWESADWQRNGLTWALALLWRQQSEAASVLSSQRQPVDV